MAKINRTRQNLAEMQEEYKEIVVGLCCVCSTPVKGWYGAYLNGGTCNKTCEEIQARKVKHDNVEADFIKKFNL